MPATWAYLTIAVGAVASSTLVEGGEMELDGSAVGTIVSAGGYEDVYGKTVGDLLYGSALIESGASISNATVLSGGEVDLSSGTVATNLVVSGGGSVRLSVIVSSGQSGTLEIDSQTGLTNVDGVVVRSGASLIYQTIDVLAGGALSLLHGEVQGLDDAGTLTVSAAEVDDVTAASGAELIITSGGVTSFSQIDNGADLVVSSGGLASGVTVGGLDYVEGGRTVGTYLVGFGTEEIVDANGVASSTDVGAYDRQYVNASGSAVRTTIEAAGYLIVNAGAHATSPLIYGGVLDYGDITGGTAESGGSVDVEAGGLLTHMAVKAGGDLILSAGGRAVSDTVSSGGAAAIVVAASRGVTTIQAATVTATTTLSGVTVLSGGSLDGLDAVGVAGRHPVAGGRRPAQRRERIGRRQADRPR